MMEELGGGVAENTVVYRGYVIPSRGRPKLTLSEMTGFRNECLNAVGHRLAGYIWQDEPFGLNVVAGNDRYDCPYVEGSTYFGDNIDDEWFIVDLLFHLTEIFPHFVFQLEDSDGDFLLIEAADSLPSWLTPSTAINRVFIFDGSLHVLPIAVTPALLTNLPASHETPSISAALITLRDYGAGLTSASKGIQRLVNERRLRSRQPSLHSVHCRLPANVGAILEADPRLIAPAVRAFYLRDPIDLRACRSATFFPPNDESMVTRRVAMTRCLYAQLTSQQFVADQRSPWAGKEPTTDSKEKKAWNLGMRITCGFEIIMNRKGKKRKDADDQTGKDSLQKRRDDNDCDEDLEWKTFACSLQKNGFFQGELEGSKKWKELMTKARQFYRETIVDVRPEQETTYVSDGIRQRIETILASPERTDVAAMRAQESLLEPEDDDGWMTIDPKELDETLEKYRRKEALSDGGKKNGRVADDENFDLDQVSKTFKNFVQHVSEFDGVEFPGSSDNQRLHRKVSSRARTQLDSDDSSDDECVAEDSDRDIDDNLAQSSSASLSRSKTGTEKAAFSHPKSSSTSSAAIPPPFSRDLSDLPTDDFDIDVDSFSKALEALVSNRSSSGVVTDEDDCDQSEDSDDDDFLGDDDDDDDEGIETLKSYMREMDRELSKTEMGKSFVRVNARPEADEVVGNPIGDASTSAEEPEHDDDDEESPLDIDMTLVKNILESYSTQPGFAGPATNILNSMGISLPDPEGPSNPK